MYSIKNTVKQYYDHKMSEDWLVLYNGEAIVVPVTTSTDDHVKSVHNNPYPNKETAQMAIFSHKKLTARAESGHQTTTETLYDENFDIIKTSTLNDCDEGTLEEIENLQMDVSQLMSHLLLEKLLGLHDEGYTFELICEAGGIAMTADNFLVKIDHYPMSAKLSKSEVEWNKLFVEDPSNVELSLTRTMVLALNTTFNTIKDKLDKVGGTCKIHFAPLEDIFYTNTPALFMYGHFVNGEFLTETNFVVIPTSGEVTNA